MNICDYLEWRGDLNFDQAPFCEVDALVFSWLAYYEYEITFNRVNYSEGIFLKDVAQEHIRRRGPFKNINLKLSIIPSVSATYLLEQASKTIRFGMVRVLEFNTVYDPENNIQFAAVTFETDSFTVIAYRGTDDSIAGWREDFELSYSKSVPAQELALSYLQKGILTYLDKKMYICGHSKGGNLAMYAILHINADEAQNVRSIYNFDGPGLNQPLCTYANYETLKDKIITILPESSIVGLLLHHEQDYQIIASEMVGILQHNAIMWQVQGTRFVCAERFRDSSIIIKQTIQTWLESIEDNEKEEIIGILFGIIQDAGIHTLDDLNDDGIQKIIKAIQNALTLTAVQKRRILQIVFALVRAGSLSVTNSLLESELATETVKSAGIVKDNIAAFFSERANKLRDAVSVGRKGIIEGAKQFGKPSKKPEE